MVKLPHGIRRYGVNFHLEWRLLLVGLSLGRRNNAARLYTQLPDPSPYVYLYKERPLTVYLLFFSVIFYRRSVA